MKSYFFVSFLSLLGFLAACGSKSGEGNLAEEGLDTLALPAFQAGLELVQGEVPEKWQRVDLDQALYIGFPKKPSFAEHKKLKRRDWSAKYNQYVLSMVVTDLSEDSAYQVNKAERQAYYEAILEDLRRDLYQDDLPVKISEKHFFSFLGQHEGLRAGLQAQDFRMYWQGVLLNDKLYTASFVAWKEPDSAQLQLKDRFFHSFGQVRASTATSQ